MTKRTSALFVAACAALAFLFVIANARAREPKPKLCFPFADAVYQAMDELGGKATVLTQDQLQFARGLWASNEPFTLPLGDSAVMVRSTEDGTAAILFVMGDQTCGKMGITFKLLTAIDEIKKGT